MSSIRTILTTALLAAVFEERLFTQVALEADPRAIGFAPDFVAMHKDWENVFHQEQNLQTTLARASAQVRAVESRIRVLVNGVSNTILLETNNDRHAAHYVRYFRDVRPSDFKHSIRDGHLGSLHEWVASLMSSTNPALKPLGAQLATALTDADARIKDELAAMGAITDFRELGERKNLIDKFNSLRKKTHGELAKIPHDHPELNLPTDYADSFFLHSSSNRHSTVERIDEEIAKREAQLIELRDKRKEVESTAAAKAKTAEEIERRANQEELRKAEKLAAQAQERIAELKAKLTAPVPSLPPPTTATPSASIPEHPA